MLEVVSSALSPDSGRKVYCRKNSDDSDTTDDDGGVRGDFELRPDHYGTFRANKEKH